MVRPPEGDPVPVDALRQWIREHREWLDARVLERGGVLLRGFSLCTAEDFHSVVAELSPELVAYTEGQSQRTRVLGKVYTSTEYPANEDITMHNELSYAHDPPRRLYFFCEVAPAEGGETPIADCRRTFEALDPSLRDRFVEKKVRYVKNMHGGGDFGGKSWQDHFETSDRNEVERYLRKGQVEFRWNPDGSLWTSQVRPAVIRHPETGESVWFNQADFWHYTNLGAKGEALRRMVGEDKLPTNAYYGDGTPIEPDVAETVRGLQWREAVVFRWEPGDLLILDNMLVCHGRRAYRGERRILVAMA